MNSSWTLQFVCLFFLNAFILNAQAEVLSLVQEDIYLEPQEDGLHLFVRKKPGISSILLTESAEPQEKYAPTYSFRSTEAFLNDKEQRFLGDVLVSNENYHFLTATSTKTHPQFDTLVFHVVIPNNLEYGFTHTRYEKIDLYQRLLTEKTPLWISIRSFSDPYNSYGGSYRDNPFEIFIEERQETATLLPSSQERHVLKPANITGLQMGTLYQLKKEAFFSSLQEQLSYHVHPRNSDQDYDLDLVLVVDVTKSMQPYLEYIRTGFVESLEDFLKEFPRYRIGLVLYKDYYEDFLTKTYPFFFDLKKVEILLNSLQAQGGGDVPEAMLEGLHAAVVGFDWRAPNRHILVVADAPGHHQPRGSISPDLVKTLLEKQSIETAVLMLSK